MASSAEDTTFQGRGSVPIADGLGWGALGSTKGIKWLLYFLGKKEGVFVGEPPLLQWG